LKQRCEGKEYGERERGQCKRKKTKKKSNTKLNPSPLPKKSKAPKVTEIQTAPHCELCGRNQQLEKHNAAEFCIGHVTTN